MGSRSASSEGSSAAGVGDSGAWLSGDPNDRVLVGRVTRAHGLQGEVKVEILSDVPDRFDPGRELLLSAEGRSAQTVLIASFRPIRGGAIVRFDGCQTREQAEILRGGRLEVPRSEVPAAPAGLYYHFDLVGCRCFDADRGELGEVTAVVEDGGGVLLEVAMPPDGAGAETGRILSVPFVEAFLESVDIAHKQIRCRLPPGLVETCASRS